MDLDELDVCSTEYVEPEFEYDYLVDDSKMLAMYYIDLYFCDKEMPNGGIIPKEVLHSSRNIDLVLNLDISNGMDLIYNAVGIEYTSEQMRYFERQGQLPDDVKYVIAMLRDCAKRGIPKQFAVGMLLIYLELCKGHKLAA